MAGDPQYTETAMRHLARRTGPIYPTLAAELLAARAHLTLSDSIAMALRADRRSRRLSQRAYAVARGWNKTLVARLEADPSRLRLGLLVAALEGTGFGLYLGRVPDAEAGTGAELAAKVEVLEGDDLCILRVMQDRRDLACEPPAAGVVPGGEPLEGAGWSAGEPLEGAGWPGGEPLDTGAWPGSELLARASNGRRLAGQLEARRTTGPAWWAQRHECEYPMPAPPNWTTGVG